MEKWRQIKWEDRAMAIMGTFPLWDRQWCPYIGDVTGSVPVILSCLVIETLVANAWGASDPGLTASWTPALQAR